MDGEMEGLISESDNQVNGQMVLIDIKDRDNIWKI